MRDNNMTTLLVVLLTAAFTMGALAAASPVVEATNDNETAAVDGIIGDDPIPPENENNTGDDGDDDADCIEYDNSSSERIIHITCDTRFEQLALSIGDPSVIENLGNNGEYLLRANIEVADDVRLTIASPDVTWVKISNEGPAEMQYNIRVRGYMDLDGVKMTSWDPDDNSVVEQESDGSVPRPFIRYQDAEGGVIENSELSHLGYDGSIRRGFSVLGDSANIEIRNSDIHHFWYAFYSNGAENVVIDGNKYHHNHKYTIDPHSGTRDMQITNNLVYKNAGIGIICSLDCENVLIESNYVYDNPKTGITLSRNTHDSIVRYNHISNSDRGITITESPNNEVYNNLIENVNDGIYLVNPPNADDGRTTDNRVYDNTIMDADNDVELFRVLDEANHVEEQED
jgi:poly(beta-D-mannuronate) C5 epimerase